MPLLPIVSSKSGLVVFEEELSTQLTDQVILSACGSLFMLKLVQSSAILTKTDRRDPGQSAKLQIEAGEFH